MRVEAGAVVRFRDRLWRVDRVADAEFAATPLDGRDTRRWRFLRAIEEPNVKPGALPLPDPSIISDPANQDLFLRAQRLHLIHGSAPFLGLQRSRAIPEPYQLVPLLMALDMAPVRLLIGDDVGVGKTIEAGLILSELVARGAAERVLVVVPPALREQWQETLTRFFHLDAVIMAGHTRPALERRLLPGQSPWDAYPIIVASIDYLKRRIGEVLSHRWDIVLFDEVHIAARPPQNVPRVALQKERWDLLDAVASSRNVVHLLLLSATPHPGESDCWASLLQCLNPATVRPDGTIRREMAMGHVVQRRRKDVKAWYGTEAPLPERCPHDEIVPLTKQETALLEGLRRYGDLLRDIEGSTVGVWVLRHLERRALSSPGAILVSLRRRLREARTGLRKLEQEAREAAEAESVVLDQDSTKDLDDEERFARMDRAALIGSREEVATLEELLDAARAITARRDGKLGRLVTLIPALFGRRPKNPRVLVFTRYKDTLDYLVSALEREGRAGQRLAGLTVFSIHGDVNQKDRRLIFRRFEQVPYAICIATDCISEGLDLQRACAELVHYEPPWNPNRFEQRCGRIDRYGQPEPTVGITTFVREDPVDVTILEALVRRANQIRRDHGFCPVFFSSARDLQRLIARYGRARQLQLPFEGPADVPGGEGDPFDEARIRKIEEESFYGQSEIRLPEVEEALQRTYRTVGSPDEVEAFVRSALARIGAPPGRHAPDSPCRHRARRPKRHDHRNVRSADRAR